MVVPLPSKQTVWVRFPSVARLGSLMFCTPRSSSGLGRRPLTAVTRVQIPYGVRIDNNRVYVYCPIQHEDDGLSGVWRNRSQCQWGRNALSAPSGVVSDRTTGRLKSGTTENRWLGRSSKRQSRYPPPNPRKGVVVFMDYFGGTFRGRPLASFMR